MSNSLKQLSLLVVAIVGLNTSARAEPIKVEQAGDRFVNFVLNEIETTRKALPDIAKAADAAAERIVRQDGELLSAGDHSFSLEPVWRAGGIAFSRQYLPEKKAAAAAVKAAGDKIPYYRTKEFVEHFTVNQATSKDVVLLGFENERQEQLHLISTVKQLLSDEALIIFFGSESSSKKLEREFGRRDNLISITHNVPDGGIIEVAGWPKKICSGRSIANRLYLWTFEAELISAFMRRGKIPGILLSVTYESPQVWNIPLLHDYKFIPAFNVTPVQRRVLGDTYLNHLRRIVSSIVPDQRKKFRQAAGWLAEAARTKHKSFALLIHGLDPDGLPGDPGLFTVFSEGNAYYPQLDDKIGKNDVALFVGYNWYPPRLANTVDKAGGKQILCFTLVQEQPPKPAIYGEVGELRHFTSFDQLPQSENRIYIDLKFAQYNAVLKIPDYPIPALETSSFAEDVVYWHLVADTIELLAKNPERKKEKAKKRVTANNAKDGAEMVLVPRGSFLMGSTTAEVDAQFRDTGLPVDWKKHTLDEQPRHLQNVPAFFIYKYEVTSEQYQAFIAATGHRSPPHWKGTNHPADRAKHPVVEVNWDDAQAYCRWAGTRLPTEAEWEYAARGASPGDGKPSLAFPWGNAWDYRLSNNSSFHAGKELQNAEDWKVWYEGDQKSLFPLTTRGGSFPKSVSPFGVHDMAGNAWEWCADFQVSYSKGDDAEQKKLRARRGGSWANVALHIRSADRQGAPQQALNLFTGFRCVKTP
jgi:formylglycine-generating enzyme required for sulfatase activity